MGTNETTPFFFSGGGEMVELVNDFDWATTPLGTMKDWPQSLRTTLSIILQSKFPMFLYWGTDLICFYNDAYRPSLGNDGKHPKALGAKAKDVWPEIWDIIYPLIVQVLNEEGATWSEDQLIPIYRNGTLEDVYWTFSYSPVIDETGKPGGVLVTCNETTQKVNALKRIEETRDLYSFSVDAAGLGTWDLNPITYKFTGNNRLKEWFGLQPDEEIDLANATNNISENYRQKVSKAIEQALQFSSGGNYDIEYAIINPITKQERMVRAKGRAFFDDDGKAYRFNGTLQDISSEIQAQEVQQELYTLVENSVDLMSILKMDGTNSYINKAGRKLLGIGENVDVTKIPISSFHTPEQIEYVNSVIVPAVMKTGHWDGNIFIKHVETGEIIPLYNNCYLIKDVNNGEAVGIGAVMRDLRPELASKKELAENEQRLSMAINATELGMWELFANSNEFIYSKNYLLILGFNENDTPTREQFLSRVYPDDLPKRNSAIKKAFLEGSLDLELRIIHPHENIRWIKVKARVFYDENQKPEKLLGTIMDITEQKMDSLQLIDTNYKFQIALESAKLGTYKFDFVTGLSTLSNRFCEYFNFGVVENVTLENIINRLHNEDKDKFRKALAVALTEKSAFNIEYRIIMPNGTFNWFSSSGQYVYDDSGNPSKIVLIISNINERKSADQTLQLSLERFKLLADSMPQLIWTGDKNGNLNYYSQAVYAYSGLSAEQIENGGWLQIVHPDDRDENIAKWIDSVTTGKDFLIEHRFRRYDGTYRWQLSRALPQIDEDGVIQMWVGTSTDIHDQKTMSQELEQKVEQRTKELQQANHELKKMNEELESFAYVASHDLQEPLRKIQTFTSRILQTDNDNISEKGKEYFDRMTYSAIRMQTLINDLLVFSRVGTTEKAYKKIHLNELILKVQKELHEEIQKKNAVLITGALPELNIIPYQFDQLFTNLITNSLKFSKEDTTPEITINASKINEKNNQNIGLEKGMIYHHITFSDNGIGFLPEYASRIFEVFQRLHGKSQYEGTGIGLAICKKIVENHNGVITAVGVPGKGATFNIYLPL